MASKRKNNIKPQSEVYTFIDWLKFLELQQIYKEVSYAC